MRGALSSQTVWVVSVCVLATLSSVSNAAARNKTKPRDRDKAWINGRGMCVFPFAADALPDTADDFATAMDRGYRRALKLPEDGPAVAAAGGTYPVVESLKIDVSGATVLNPEKKGRKPSDRQLAIHGLDAAKFEFLGKRMSVANTPVDLDLTATDARLLFTRDKDGKPLLVLGKARHGRLSVEMRHPDVERLLLAAARRGGKGFGLAVDKTRLRMSVENGRIVRVDLKLFTRVGFIPAGLRFRAKLDIDDNLNGTLSQLSCTGDQVLGPLVSGLIGPFLARYNGMTRPLMNFPQTDMRLRDVVIASDDSVRLTADFGG